MSEMKTVRLERASGPGYEAVQAMPFDTSKLKTITLASTQEWDIIDLAPETGLIEVIVVPSAASAPVYMQNHSADGSVFGGVYMQPGKQTYTVAPPVVVADLPGATEPRTLLIYVPPGSIPDEGEIIVQILEAD